MSGNSNNFTATEPVDLFAFFTEVGILNQLSRALFEAELPDGLQVIHFSVLNNLVKRSEGRLPSELAKAFQVPRSNMTDILVRLQELGLIELKANPKDGRSKLVYLTDAGRAFRMESIQKTQTSLNELAERFDVRSLSGVLPILVELREVMDAMRTS